MPSVLANNIKSVDKSYLIRYFKSDNFSVQTSSLSIWIPSYYDIYGDSTIEHIWGSRDWFSTMNPIKYKLNDTSPSSWWLCTAGTTRTAGSRYEFYYVDAEGNAREKSMFTRFGICFGFCT
jgi:hypothetical protein